MREKGFTCVDVRRMHAAYVAGGLSDSRREAFEAHCLECEHCRRLVDIPAPHLYEPPPRLEPPPYLAAEIVAEARGRCAPQRKAARRRLIGSTPFLATCAAIAAGTILTLVAVYHYNRIQPRQDTHVPVVFVKSGQGVLILADPNDPMREQTPEEILEKIQRGKIVLQYGPDLGGKGAVARGTADMVILRYSSGGASTIDHPDQ
jgi:hypothetical protein